MGFKDWLLTRAKAFVAIASVPIVTAVMKGVEGAIGFDIPAEIELLVVTTITGGLVYQVPNKKV